MLTTVIPNTDFIHDDRRFHRGRAAQIHESIALDLERRGLVRIAPLEVPVVPNVLDGGAVAPPSVLPVDQASQKRPVIKLKRPADETKHFE